MSHWLERFTLEVRKVNGTEYQPNTLYHIVCGIMRHLRNQRQADIDFFKDPEFAGLRRTLDAEMKRLLYSQASRAIYNGPYAIIEFQIMHTCTVLAGNGLGVMKKLHYFH